jgi:hypothetical protein
MLSNILLAALAQNPADAVRLESWIHDGLSAAPAAWQLDDPDAATRLAFDLALLVPERTSGLAVPAAARTAAAQRTLTAWLGGESHAQRDAVAARLQGMSGAEGARRLAAALAKPAEGGPSADQIAALLKSIPLAESASALLAAVLDEEVHPGVRGDLAATLLLAHGRPALAAIAPVLVPASDERLLRQIFAAWRPIATPEDIPLLERIAREGYGASVQFALQLWSRLEFDPARRLTALEFAMAAPGGYANLALDALASNGPEPLLAERLRFFLRTGTSGQRSLALRALGRLDSHQAVLDLYRELEKTPTTASSGWWMPVLAQSPLPEARAAAARWLTEGGFSSGSLALVIVRSLSDTPEIRPLLGVLLEQPEVPSGVRTPLALAHAQESPAARAYLRSLARHGSGHEQMLSVQALGGIAEPEDLAWFAELAHGSEFEPAVRGLALEQLLRNRTGADVVAEFLSGPLEWELAEALVRNAIEYGPAELREAALTCALDPQRWATEEERSALRTVAWQALGTHGHREGLPALVRGTIRELERLEPEGRPAEEDWRDILERVHAWSELESLASAARILTLPISARPASPELRDWDPLLTSPEVLWSAAALWSGADPEQAVLWLDALEAMDLTEANRVRVLALRAARARQPLDARRSLRDLLADPRLLREYPLLLAQAFAPPGAGWTLFHDRLREREILADARCQPAELALLRLAMLMDGWTEPEVLLTAARTAAELPQGGSLALRLTQRGRSLHPLHPDLAMFQAELLTGAGAAAAAHEVWREVLRLVPPGFAQHELAATRLGQR